MVLDLEKDSATTVDAMAIPLPPWLTREYDYASGIRRTGEVIARNLQRRRELEIEAVRAAAAAQQAQALEQYRRAQAEELQRKATQEENERLDWQKRMTDFNLMVGHGKDRFQTALDLGLVPQSSLPSFLAAQEAAKRAAEKDNRTADQIQREDIIRLMRAAAEGDKAAETELEIAKQQARIGDNGGTGFERNVRRILELETKLPTAGSQDEDSAIRKEIDMRRKELGEKLPEEGELSPKTRAEISILRDEKKRLEGTKPTPENKAALLIVNKRLSDLTGAQGLETMPPEVRGKSIDFLESLMRRFRGEPKTATEQAPTQAVSRPTNVPPNYVRARDKKTGQLGWADPTDPNVEIIQP